MYEGRTDFKEGRASAMRRRGSHRGRRCGRQDQSRRHDSAPFNVACGHCRNCEEGLTNYCLRANEPGKPAPPTGSPTWGPGRAARPSCCACRGPISTLCGCPRTPREKQDDYVMLSDIFPTGWHACGCRLAPRRNHRNLRQRSGRVHGRALGDHHGRVQGHGRGPPSGPAPARRVRSARSRSTTPRLAG